MAENAQSKQQETIVAYGFDEIGLVLPPALQRPEYQIEWVPYGSADIPEAVRGIVFPSGIFEKIEYSRTFMDDRYAEVRSDRERLLTLERLVANLLRSGGWVAILAREIIDDFPSGNSRYGTYRQDDTDLAKRLLNGLSVKRRRYPEGTGMVASKRDEFSPYTKRWGIARTFFEVGGSARVLAKVGDAVVGFECDARIFVLPFQPSRKSADEAEEIGDTLARAILDYRRKMLVELPAWVGDFQFLGEQKLRDERQTLLERLIQVESGLKSWEKRKIVLVSSGVALKDAQVDILKDFFGLDVDSLDEGREDFKIVDAKTVIAVGEAKGTNGGITREYINQVDSHRERLGLTEAVPGLLLINNQMNVSGIAQRRETQVALEQVRHARRMNILIVRTIDLLYLMRHLEGEVDKGAKFITLIQGGGGWLAADDSGYRISTGAVSG